MKKFNITTKSARRKFLEQKIWVFQFNLSANARIRPDTLFSSLSTLQRLRMGFYEDLNQLFHSVAIIEAHRQLCELIQYRKLDWEWNPAQQGSSTEPDLRGVKNGKVVVSVEVNTSHDAKSAIGKRLKEVCLKLEKMRGKKIFFVANEKVQKFLNGFVARSNLSVEVISLGIGQEDEANRGRIHQGI